MNGSPAIWNRKFQSTRPVRGATRAISSPFIRYPIFQSTRPVRGATDIPRHRRLEFIFQSTRPVRGATCPRCPLSGCRRNFNPRAPCGARRSSVSCKVMFSIFQSTRPVRGATCLYRTGASDCAISIHAPRAGRDGRDPEIGDADTVFQSTRPVRGATQADAGRAAFGLISIHAPRAGRD